MTATTRSGLRILALAVLLGILGDSLLNTTPWGLNLFVWTAALTGGYGALRHKQERTPAAGERGLLAGTLFFAAAFVWRDSPTLRTLDCFAVLIALSLLTTRKEALGIAFSGVWDYAGDMGRMLFAALFGGFRLLGTDIAWEAIPRGGWSRGALAVARGLAIALPLLIFFGGLLASADAVFSHFVGLVFQWDMGSVLHHLWLTLLCTWLAAGILHALVSVAAPAAEPAVITPRPQRVVLGTIETGTVLGLLDLLFLSFVLVQLRFFFGGAALVQATIGLTYAQYARQGFFEIVAVAALVLPLLLVLHHWQRPEDGRAKRLFQWLAGLQVGLLFVILASAALRMRLYQSEYGLTELRLYTSAFMAWLAVVFVWFLATVLRGRRHRFAFGALLAGGVALLVLHAVNPDAAIVRANLARAQAGYSFDSDYALSLSDDAVPVLAAALPRLAPTDQGRVSRSLRQRHAALSHQDWRAWSVSRALAWRSTLPAD